MRAPSTGHDPAVALRAAAGACWAVTAVLVLAGAPGPCRDGVALDGTGGAPPAAAFAAWLVMTGAMMLPTVVPLARMFVVVTARAPHPAPTRLALVGGYLAVWSVFAALAVIVHRAVDVLFDGAARPRFVLGAVLISAGLFQFTALKRACLVACRSPWAFLWRHYGRGPRKAWTLGMRHGLLCLGCCWALMLVMVATGIGSLLWMLALTAVMTLEKTAPWGARLVAPVGAALVVAGIAVLVGAAASETALLVAAVATAIACVTEHRNRDRAAARPAGHDDPTPRVGAHGHGAAPAP